MFFIPDLNSKKTVADYSHRIEMINIAIKKISKNINPECWIIKKKFVKNYMFRSFCDIKRENFGSKIYLLLGSDSFFYLDSWQCFVDLIKQCVFVIILRDRSNRVKVAEKIRIIRDAYDCNIYTFDIDTLNISSTIIRTKILLNQSINFLVPGDEKKYICDKKLYQNANLNAFRNNLDYLKKQVKNNLSEKKFIHSLCVADQSVKLAEYYKQDIMKSYIAGLLHDYAKEFTSTEKIIMSHELGLELDGVLRQQPDLIHPFLASKIAQKKLNVNDREILDAIAYHTTGRSGMSIIEKIVYLADCIEPNRTYSDTIKIRELCYKNINQAMRNRLNSVVSQNLMRNRKIHKFSIEAINYFKMFNYSKSS
jgi:nicotinate-nucleotide adenylyltransferase